MASTYPQILEDTSSAEDPAQTMTLHSTSTAWTQTTVWVVGGPVQLPEVTEYSYLQPIELASYPDPIMSATGTDLQSLLKQKHVMATSGSVSDAIESSATDIYVIPITYTTVYPTTFLTTIYPTDSMLEPTNIKSQPSVPAASISLASTDIFIQISGQTSSSRTPTTNTVIPITIETSTSSIVSSLLGRREPVRNIDITAFETNLFHDNPHTSSPSTSSSQSACTITISVLSAILLTSLIIHLVFKVSNREDPTEVSYTSKPPRPGLRKRLSLSISMTAIRRPSVTSTGSTEATYVSGNAVSIGKAGGKNLGIGLKHGAGGNVGREVRRTPSTPVLEV